MRKQIELCRPCAEKLMNGYTVTLVQHRINNKITCEECQKRRYGGTYLIETTKRSRKKTEE